MLRGIKWGSFFTLALLVETQANIWFDFDVLFLNFHYLFFEGESFLFDAHDTLIRLYPEQFWFDGALVVGALSFIIACLSFFGARQLLRKNLLETKSGCPIFSIRNISSKWPLSCASRDYDLLTNGI